MVDVPAKTDVFEETQQMWEVVGDQLDAFSTAWDNADVGKPKIRDFLPAASAICRRLTLVELVKFDMEQRWSSDDEPLLVEDYARDYAELAVGNRLPADLIYEELHIRRQAGNEVDCDEYYQRFPNQTDELRQLLEIENPDRTTALHAGRAPAKLELDEQFEDFELLSKLGHGAFASVFLARQISMQRLVALKVTSDQSAEPQTLARLDHPNIVRVFDLRSLEDRGLRLLYMQYVPGGTLQEALSLCWETGAAERNGRTFLAAVDEKLSTRGVPTPADSQHRQRISECSWYDVVCFVGAELAAAIDYAHQQGVLHRDIKPANVLLTEIGTAKLVDFNVSACSKLDGVSPESHFGGSLVYMSPEQLEASNPLHERLPASLDHRLDIYALGVVLFEMATGKRPFRDDAVGTDWSVTLGEMVDQRRGDVGKLVNEKIPPECPKPLRDTISKCLAPNPDERFQSGSEMETQLRLSLDPDAYRLLSEPTARWQRWILASPILTVVFLLILPNAIAGFFNYVYNRELIVERLANSQSVFWVVQLIVNGIAFPLGAYLALRMARPIKQVIENDRLTHSRNELETARKRCLKLGHYLALIGLAEWLVAGFIYPVALSIANVPLARGDYFHFFGSLAICGLMAAAYPFFALTAVVIEILYPAMVRPESVPSTDIPMFAWLNRISWTYLVIAVAVPMVSVALLGGNDNEFAKVALRVLSIGGTVIFVVIFALARRVQSDIGTLQRVATDAVGSGN